ncbi:MAG TPA: chemotaxis protein CheW, partial [Bacteriovoracaceae bacterium]|nr:chemotaxis protein CheW [Bacteriovoracaceae bacterium]
MNLSLEEQQEFKQEANELIECMESNFLELEMGADLGPRYDEIFRSLHNLKGTASMMNFTSLKDLVHEMETSFTSYKGQEKIDEEVLARLIQDVDRCKKILQGEENGPVEESRPRPESTSLDEVFVEVVNQYENWSNHLEDGDAVVKVQNELSKLIELSKKSNQSIFIISEVISNCLKSNNLDLKKKFVVGQKGLELIDKIQELISVGASVQECLPISQKFKETIENKVYQKNVANVTALNSVESSAGAATVTTSADSSKNADNSSIRVNVGLLDSLLNLMGELVLVRNEALQFYDHNQHHELGVITKKLNLVTSEIQEQMMKTRMQPIGVVLSKLNRIVRDVGKLLGKKINLQLEGIETEVDRTILDAIKDPLTHIVRNACDHGIERPEERKLAQKAENGQLKVSVYQEGGQVIIDVIDDGRGLNKERIINKAIQNNILKENEVSSLDDRDIYNLIFHAGFSTADVVTDISGRGVGMDVVKTNIEAIDGSIEIFSEVGKGSTFRIKIPLTLAIIPVLTVAVEDEVFSIPQGRLLELLNVESSSEDISTLQGKKILNYRGNLIPIIYLSEYLFAQSKELEIQPVVIVSHEESIFALAVDQIQETFDIVIKPVPKIIKNIGLYSGATVLGDGRISLILDVSGIAKKIGARPRKVFENITNDTEIIQSLLIFKVGTNDYAISMNYINRIEEINRSQISKSGNYDVIEYRGGLLPLVGMDILFDCQYSSEEDQPMKVIVIDRAEKNYGILVDEIYDALTTQSDLMPPVNNEVGIFGTIKIQGKFYSIIDPFTLISKWKGEQVELEKVHFSEAENHTVLI